MDNINEDIIKYSKELKLPVFRRDFKVLATEAVTQRLTYNAYLLCLMERGYERGMENREKMQIRQAGSPVKMCLTHLVRSRLPSSAQEKHPLPERLDFIKSAQNISLDGNISIARRLNGSTALTNHKLNNCRLNNLPGTGKTHLATGLGLIACTVG
jgi:hypothetical protein